MLEGASFPAAEADTLAALCDCATASASAHGARGLDVVGAHARDGKGVGVVREVEPRALGGALDCEHANRSSRLTVADGRVAHEVTLNEGFERFILSDIFCAATRRAALREEDAVGANGGSHCGAHMLSGSAGDRSDCRAIRVIWIDGDDARTDANKCGRTNTTTMLHPNPAGRCTTSDVAVHVDGYGTHSVGDRVGSIERWG